MYKIFCLFGGYVPLENFLHSYGGVTITGERLQILSYTRHSLPLSSEGSLARPTPVVTRDIRLKVISEDPFIMAVSEDP